ncbi:uncharacterized protein BXZ73DRAFT_108366 [Epithele typhae]|uniref:uncharacterized protein n=1 Tax=Epithele typhae TaxID=378194 RepID=UPI0020075234|nr:uncharacterized protein BXZ73DRAFT_108366 [Epithele typhae]KAH9910911.1 hypothetical protein BXZ73DRAFT_108366 [Epithele typhae]
MADAWTVIGILASILGIIGAVIATYTTMVPPTVLVEKSEKLRKETREYLEKVYADGLIDDTFFSEYDQIEMQPVELDVMELHGVLFEPRPWYRRPHFWYTTWVNVRVCCRCLTRIQANIASRASMTRRQQLDQSRTLEREVTLTPSECTLASDEAEKTVSQDVVLHKLERGAFDPSPPPSVAEEPPVSSRTRWSFDVVKHSWSSMRARIGPSRKSQHELPLFVGEKRRRAGTAGGGPITHVMTALSQC